MMCNSTLVNLPEYWKTTFGILCLVLSLLATLENAVVVIIIYKNKILRTPSNRILLSLAVSNLLTGIILAPLYVAQLLSNAVVVNCFVDLGRRYVSAVLLGSALLSVGFISYDRCLHLIHLRNYKMSTKKMIIILTICWFVPIIIPLFRYADESETVYAIIVIILGSVMLLVIVISYIGLLLALNSHTNHDDNKMSRTYMSNERRAGRTVIIIVFISFFVGLPLLIYFGMVLGGQHDDVFLAKTYIFVMFLSMLNAVLKPLVYCYRTPLLRKYAKELLGMKSTQDTINPRNGDNQISLHNCRTWSTQT